MKYRVFKQVLDSGLTVVTVETPHLHSAMLALYVRAGSRHETPRTNGVAHFLEHMFFRGSRRFPDTVDMNAQVEAAGGNLNGVTARDHGYYYTPIHPAHVDVGIRVLGDMLSHPLLPKMEVEREVILEEMLDEVDEDGRDIDVDNLSKMTLYADHPLGLKIAGTRSSVRDLNRADLRVQLTQRYVTGNVVFTAAGPVSHRKVVRQVERAFRGLREGARTTEVPPPRWRAGPQLRFVEHDESQTELRLSWKTVPEHDPDHPAIQLLRRVLDDGLSSRLPFNVIEKRGLAYSLHASIETFHDDGLFEVDGACAPHKVTRVLDEVCRTIGELTRRRVTAGELSRAKRRHRMMLEFAQDSAGELAGWFGGSELWRTPESFEERCRMVERQTADRLQQVARRYFHRENLLVTAVGQRRGMRALRGAVERAPGLPRGPR